MRRMFTTEEWNQSHPDDKIIIAPLRGGEVIASHTNEVGINRGPFFIYTKFNEKWVEMTSEETEVLHVWNDTTLKMVLELV